MSLLDDWIRDAAGALSLPHESIPVDLRDALLLVTRDVAHDVTRIGGPLTCYLLGIAVGRGMAPSAAVRAITDLLAGRPPAPAEPGPAATDTKASEQA